MKLHQSPHATEPTIVRHHRQDGYAVSFVRNGRAYLTSFTRRKDEAEAWAYSVTVYGWSVAGRPCPIHPDEIAA